MKELKRPFVLVMLLVLFTSCFPFFGLVPKAESLEAPPSIEWTKTYGGSNWEHGSSLVQTSDGGYALVGRTLSYGAGDWDAWLVKTDVDGNMEWSQTYGGANSDIGFSIVQTSDGGYAIAGETDSYGAGGTDFWLVKTDVDGNVEWNQTYGGTYYDHGRFLVQTTDGGYAITGGITYDPYHSDVWLVKTDADGNQMWNRTYGGGGFDDGYSLVQTSDGGYAITGPTYSYGAAQADFWLVKTDTNGNLQWNQTYGGWNDEWGHSVVQSSDGGYVIGGFTSSFGAGGEDFLLVKVHARAPVSTDITINTGCSSTVVGFQVEINGSLVDSFGTGLADETVVLSYTFEGISSWIPITSDKTDTFGRYSATWIPPATGYFTIKAEWAGNSTHIESENSTSISSITFDEYVFSVESNSTISNFFFNSTDQTLSFIAGGSEETQGYAKITISKSLVTNLANFRVYLDDNPTEYKMLLTDDSLIITMNYPYSTHQVLIDLNINVIPEFSSWTILPLVLTITLFLIIVKRNLHKTKAS